MTAAEKHGERYTRLIERWFPVAAVDEACGTAEGSGRNEKAIFTWFASRPIAQARAAVLCSLLEEHDDDGDEALRQLVERATIRGDPEAIAAVAERIPTPNGRRPSVLDCFSGRGIIALEAGRFGLNGVGTDLLPVAVLASRLLGDWPLRDWSDQPDVPWQGSSIATDDAEEDETTLFDVDEAEPKLVRDLRAFLAEVGRRTLDSCQALYPANADGSLPWGYLWATTIPCDQCRRRFPLVGALVLRHPNARQEDAGQAFAIVADADRGTWSVEIHEGPPAANPTYVAAPGTRGKSGRCPFCGHQHPLETIKAKGFAKQYEDAPLVAADIVQVEVPSGKRTRTIERKVFRNLRPDELRAATNVAITEIDGFGSLSAIPNERIAPGNASTIDASGYGYETFAELMNTRQAAHFAYTVHAIRSCHTDLIGAGFAPEYAAVLAGYGAANLVRKIRRSTRGAKLLAFGGSANRAQTWVQVHDVFANESGVNFNFDFFETGPGPGPGAWASISKTGLTVLAKHIAGLTEIATSARFRLASATALPYRDHTVDAVVTDPPYYEMINYADVSDLFYVWLRRCLFDILPDLFGEAGDTTGLQDKSEEIVVKQGRAPGDHRTPGWYEEQLAKAFDEMRRVLKPSGTLSVVFGHSDPAAWRRLLGALRDANFVVTSAWPARTESGNTGVASIKVTVTIGCRLASDGRASVTAARVEREIVELIRKRVPKWDKWGLALSDQLMAAYGPAMQVVGRYRAIQRPDGSEPDLDYFLGVGRRAVAEAHAFKIDELPLDTFDPETRFAIFWLRAFGSTVVNKGEAVFHAQSSQMRIDMLRPHILEESKAGFAVSLAPPAAVTDRTSTIQVARALAGAWPTGATDAVAQILLNWQRSPDDAHLWATVAELVRQLPESDKTAMALTACQRNRRAIEAEARHVAAATASPEALPFEELGGEQ